MKKLIFWLFGVCASVSLSGCGSDETDPMGPTEALEAPVPVVTVDGAKATVRWNAVENAHQYGWELKAGAEDEAPETGSSFVNNCSFTMDDGILYEFRVRSLARSGSQYKDSDWSEYVSASSNMLPAPKPAIDPVSLTDTSVTLEWEAVENAREYKYELADRENDLIKSGTESGLSITFDELTEGTAYQFRIMTVSGAVGKSDSPWSSYVVFTTRQHEQLSAPVAAVKSRTAVSAEIAWSAVDKAVKYAYRLYESSLESSPVQESETSEVSITLSDLKESTDYWFVIRSVSDEKDPYT
ncbi:MAG: fibronectin type III domain-containing protein, partial [Alistipes sp.]|nr:fibronectin type III domain-containing protein [Alistipes sp.]